MSAELETRQSFERFKRLAKGLVAASKKEPEKEASRSSRIKKRNYGSMGKFRK